MLFALKCVSHCYYWYQLWEQWILWYCRLSVIAHWDYIHLLVPFPIPPIWSPLSPFNLHSSFFPKHMMDDSKHLSFWFILFHSIRWSLVSSISGGRWGRCDLLFCVDESHSAVNVHFCYSFVLISTQPEATAWLLWVALWWIGPCKGLCSFTDSDCFICESRSVIAGLHGSSIFGSEELPQWSPYNRL